MSEMGSSQATPIRDSLQERDLPDIYFDDGRWYKLTESAKDVYIQLRRKRNRYGVSIMTLDALREKSGLVTRAALNNALARLQVAGMLIRRVKPSGSAAGLQAKGLEKGVWYFYT